MGNGFKWIATVLCVLAFGAGGVTATVAAEGEEIDRHGMENDLPLPTDAAAIENGKERYGARCSYCHTPLGRGGSSSVCLACQKYKWGSKSSAIYATIAAGRPGTKMGAFATSLTQDEMLNIIAYIRTLQEKKIQDDLAAAKQ
ncbi:MAG: c-type cytochrome [Burkholderiales bacterium]|jgi:mono/diheme cytochrome c family protein|nr:c-type cytochrome [Burkholderiales bacterium]